MSATPEQGSLITIIIALVTCVFGYMFGAAIRARVPDPPQPLPPHEHLWGEWEQVEEPTRLYNAGGDWIADEYVQHRQCVTCGFVERDATRI